MAPGGDPEAPLRSITDEAAARWSQTWRVHRSWSPLRVVVAGGGFAAAELVLALRSLAHERVRLELIAPSSRLIFKPAATGVAFDASAVQEYDLRELAADVGGDLSA